MSPQTPTEPASERQRRALCLRCQRPERACICAWIRLLDNEVELLVLQHPLEAHEAKGTARLLQLSLARCTVIVGEQFDTAGLGALDATALLYPATGTEPMPRQAIRRLVLIDATWRKSRKMLHLNPWLLALPRLALADPPASCYGVLRRAHQAHQLSTLEAGLLALQQVEGGEPGRYAPLREAFEGFVAGQSPHNYNPAPFIDSRVSRV